MSFRDLMIEWKTANDEIHVKNKAITNENDINGRRLTVEINDFENIDDYDLNFYWESTVGLDSSFDKMEKKQKGKFSVFLPRNLNNQGVDVRCLLQLVHKNKEEQLHSREFMIHVEKGINNGIIKKSSEYTVIQELIITVKELEENYLEWADNVEQNEKNRQIFFDYLVEDIDELQSDFKANETIRQTNETSRQTNELVREQAENNRQSTFETNEVERQNEFEENEQGRESAESVRVSNEEERELNEAERISKDSERDSKIEAVEREFRNLSDISMVNMLKNANFYDTSDWKTVNATLTAENNELKIVSISEELRTEVYQPLSVDPTSMYYIAGHVKTTSDKVRLTVHSSSGWTVYHSGSGNYERLSTNYSPGGQTERFLQIFDERINEMRDPIFISKFLLVDLTSVFGKGNEPTVEQMDVLLEQFPNGWFDGTVNVYNGKHILNMFFKELTKLNNAITTLGGNV